MVRQRSVRERAGTVLPEGPEPARASSSTGTRQRTASHDKGSGKVRHTVIPMRRQRSATAEDPMRPAWPGATATLGIDGAPAEAYCSPLAGQAAGGALSAVRGRIGDAEDASELRRRPDDWILDLVDALPLPVKSVLPLLGALAGILMLFQASAVSTDAQGLVQIGMVALAGLLAGHIIQCCSVGALLLAYRVLAAGPAILKGFLVVGAAAVLLHAFGITAP